MGFVEGVEKVIEIVRFCGATKHQRHPANHARLANLSMRPPSPLVDQIGEVTGYNA